MQARRRRTIIRDVTTPAATSARSPEDVVLRDGSTLRLRPPTPEDEAGVDRVLRGAFAGQPLPALPRRVTSTTDRVRWPRYRLVDSRVARRRARRRDGGARPVALATYVRLRDPRRAEVAFAVADELHGRGVGTRLLERLAAHAAAAGIEEFVAEVLPRNTAMLRVLDDAGFETSRTLAGRRRRGRVASRRRRPAVVERRDERDHVAVAASLRPFFEPRSVAVIGASPRRGTIGGELFRNILAADSPAPPIRSTAAASPSAVSAAYATIADVPVVVDLAVICVPGAHGARRRALGARGRVKALCVISAGFAETGAEGAERQDELLALVRAHGARLIGPNCLGIAVERARLNATFARRGAPAGRIGFSSQSGALGLALLEEADARGLGLSSFVSIGNKADVSSNDLLEYWEDDPRHRRRAALPRVVRQPAQVRAHREPCRPQRSRSSRWRAGRAARERARRARTPPRSRAPTPPSTRCSGRPA